MPNEFEGLPVLWPHHCSLPWAGHRSVTFTMIDCPKGPLNAGE